MGAGRKLWKAVRDPSAILSAANRQVHTRGGYRKPNPNGVDMFSEDWDYLIILDACRADIFREECSLSGETVVRTSKGSASKEFIRANFADRDLRDTIYVSANQWYGLLEDELNCELFRYHPTDRDLCDGLTSSPETVVENTCDLAAEHPNKRVVVHFMQPHDPFIGEFGRSVFKEAEGGLRAVVNESGASDSDLRKAYRENLNLVLEAVEELFDRLSGRFVVTADHGELLGERESPLPVKSYGHPPGVYCPELVNVPWHTHESGERRTMTKDTPQGFESDAESVKSNLEDLGYL
jgi:hypothetical protein